MEIRKHGAYILKSIPDNKIKEAFCRKAHFRRKQTSLELQYFITSVERKDIR